MIPLSAILLQLAWGIGHTHNKHVPIAGVFESALQETLA
jgi:hypothetical protein